MRCLAILLFAFLVGFGAGCAEGDSARWGGSEEAAGLTAMRIEPENAALEVTPDEPARQAFRVIGFFEDGTDQDITDWVELAVSAGLGSFHKNELTSQTARGGSGEVIAAINDANGAPILEARTGLTLHFTATILDLAASPPIPEDPGKYFEGEPDPGRAPDLLYPNDGVLFPPNLSRLEVHYRSGSPKNTLFEVAWTSPTIDLRAYARCPKTVNSGCILELDPKTYAYLTESTAGEGPVKLRVRGGDDAGEGFGESAEFTVSFSRQNVKGGLYYWTTSNGTAIMRFDFGAEASAPEVFLSPDKDNLDKCIGCHVISPSGKRFAASMGGQWDGRLVYIPTLLDPSVIELPAGDPSRVQFASFSPAEDRFVSVFGDVDGPERNRLWFHDAETGLRIPGDWIDLPFEPTHPAWSPRGDFIAMTRVGQHHTSQRPYNCGIELVARAEGGGWEAPETLVPIGPGMSRYNPSFSPGADLLVFSESTCPGGDITSVECDGDGDESAKTYVIRPEPGSSPILLAKAGAPGAADAGKTDLADTFPRFSPFEGAEKQGRIMWVTISSRRRAGLYDPNGNQLLWMFAIDPDKVLAGEDGSYAPFFLPFQDLTTSNHIAEWTQHIYTDTPL
jgi:hypothetical protein